ncbi:MAG TPA: hypothetical protein VEG60_33225 [Candidatus Binatia bacterium]|nr:hypothetical protein [Candidatus Binatia bacterium]
MPGIMHDKNMPNILSRFGKAEVCSGVRTSMGKADGEEELASEIPTDSVNEAT